jgi:restriction endonuclease S subunit
MKIHPNGWEVKKLEDVADVIDPHPSHRAPAIDPNGIPFVGIGDVREDGAADFRKARLVSTKILSEHAKRYSLQNGLIGLGRVASVGKVVRLPKGEIPYTISPTLAVIAPLKVSFEFLYYVLQSPQIQNQLNGLKQGSGRQSVGILKLRKVEIPIPPIDEQHKIVETLESNFLHLDGALVDVKQVKIKAAQLRRSLLQAAFTGNLINYGTSYMTELPGNWRLERFGDVFKVKYGKSIEKSQRFDFAKFPVVGSAGVMTYTNTPLISEPTIVIGRKGNVGSIQIFKEGCYPIDTTYYISTSSEFDINFLNYLLVSLELVKLDSSTATPSLRREDLDNIQLVIPPIEEQLKIVEVLEEQFLRLDTYVTLVDSIEKQSGGLRRSLLHAAFTGQLTKGVVSV